jgi:alpha-tubulin suppressor-like RCC1 family protein
MPPSKLRLALLAALAVSRPTALAVTAGRHHTCAILDNGGVKCWGYNGHGQLGLGDTNERGDGANEMADSLAYVSLGAGRTALAVTAGEVHTCATLDNGGVKCWGYNYYGQLGLGDTNNRGDGANEMADSLAYVSLRLLTSTTTRTTTTTTTRPPLATVIAGLPVPTLTATANARGWVNLTIAPGNLLTPTSDNFTLRPSPQGRRHKV